MERFSATISTHIHHGARETTTTTAKQQSPQNTMDETNSTKSTSSPNNSHPYQSIHPIQSIHPTEPSLPQSPPQQDKGKRKKKNKVNKTEIDLLLCSEEMFNTQLLSGLKSIHLGDDSSSETTTAAAISTSSHGSEAMDVDESKTGQFVYVVLRDVRDVCAGDVEKLDPKNPWSLVCFSHFVVSWSLGTLCSLRGYPHRPFSLNKHKNFRRRQQPRLGILEKDCHLFEDSFF